MSEGVNKLRGDLPTLIYQGMSVMSADNLTGLIEFEEPCEGRLSSTVP